MQLKPLDSQFFTKILTSTHPLCQEVVRSVVHPRPGIYLIAEIDVQVNPAEPRVIYVGRSTTNLQQRLVQHCRNRDYQGLHFSFYYAKSGLESYRLESRAFFYFNRICKLKNRVHAASLTRKPST